MYIYMNCFFSSSQIDYLNVNIGCLKQDKFDLYLIWFQIDDLNVELLLEGMMVGHNGRCYKVNVLNVKFHECYWFIQC